MLKKKKNKAAKDLITVATKIPKNRDNVLLDKPSHR